VHELWTVAACLLLLTSCSVDQTTSVAEPDASAGGASPDGATFPTAEDCGNGEDEDLDGLIDCADDDCSSYTCAPVVSDGWTGPVALYLGTDPSPDCGAAGGFTTLAFDGGTLDSLGYTCPACGCDPTPVTCTPTVTSYTGQNCVSQASSMTGQGCHTFDSTTSQDSIKLAISAPT